MARLGAGVRKREDGTLEKRITINGKRYSIYSKSQKELSTKEQELRNMIAAGIYKNNRKVTLNAYFDEWIDGKRGKVKASSIRGYKSYYKNHIKPSIGSRRVQEIERREIVNLQNEIADKLSIHAANYVVMILKIVLNDAIADEIIDKNPAAAVKNLKENNKAVETYHRALTESEQAAFMQEIKGDYFYEMIALMLCTGMRAGETAALTWNDIDYKNNVIHVKSTLTYLEDGRLVAGDTAKSAAGNRDIPMTDTIRKLISDHRDKMGNIISINKNTPVFLSVRGGVVRHKAVNAVIFRALKSLDNKGVHIEKFTAHAFRDTFATRYIEQGGNPQTLKTLLGHSSLAMTMDLYSHVLPNTRQQEMDRIHIAI